MTVGDTNLALFVAAAVQEFVLHVMEAERCNSISQCNRVPAGGDPLASRGESGCAD